MTQSSITTQLVNAMETDLVPRNSNPLIDKIVHADIRVRGIEDVDADSRSDVSNVQLVEQPLPNDQDVGEQERAEEMQSWWNSEMRKHMNQPDGYAKVGVLLIKWADDLDELKTRKETEELDLLFRTRFHYTTKTVELNVRTKPQHQLNSHISDFIRDNDGPNNLLIVYYTGHGLFREDKKYLELSSSNNPAACEGFGRDARANWNKVEEELRDDEVEADVLTILDTCYASNFVRKSGKRAIKKFELVAACAIDQTTASPGKYSFTRALIDALKELLDVHKDPISTWRLQQRINLNKNRSETPALIWSREQDNEHHIFLAPLKTSEVAQPPGFRHTPGGYLTLRLGLRDPCLNKEQIEYMTKTLSKALFNKALVGLRKVEWLEMRRAPPIPRLDRVALVMYAVTQWRKAIRKKKMDRESQRLSQRRVDEVVFPEEMEISPTLSQKRSQDGLGEFPAAKRQFTDPSQPPSPPVSNSSLVEY